MKLVNIVSAILELCKIPPVVIDGILCALVASTVEINTCLTSDDAYKYVNVTFLWYWKLTNGTIGAVGSALVFFRSKSYTDHLTKQKEQNEKQNPTPVVTNSTLVN